MPAPAWFDWKSLVTPLATAGTIAAMVLAWKLAGGSTWAKDAEARHEAKRKPVACPRCGKDVPPWFIDTTRPLPALGLSTRALAIQKDRGGTLADAQIAASIEAPVKEHGCLVCGGAATTYPAPGQSRRSFSRGQ